MFCSPASTRHLCWPVLDEPRFKVRFRASQAGPIRWTPELHRCPSNRVSLEGPQRSPIQGSLHSGSMSSTLILMFLALPGSLGQAFPNTDNRCSQVSHTREFCFVSFSSARCGDACSCWPVGLHLNPILTGEKHMLESSPWFPLRPEFTDADFYLLARLRPWGLESTCPGVRWAMERSENSCTVGAAASRAQHVACTAWFLTFTASCGVCPFFLHTDG